MDVAFFPLAWPLGSLVIWYKIQDKESVPFDQKEIITSTNKNEKNVIILIRTLMDHLFPVDHFVYSFFWV